MNNTPNITQDTKITGSANSGSANETVVEDPTVDSGVSQTQEYTTQFIDDANVVTRSLNHMAHIDNTILGLQDTNNDDQSIVSFLSKPIIFSQGTFSVTDTYSFLNSYSMPYTALQATQGLVWRQKLAGVFGIRMDMKFRIVVNADRFQQGRYCMGWVPLAGPIRTTSALKEIAFNNTHMATLVQRTTVPHVEIDLASDTVAELIIPFVSSRAYYSLNAILSSSDIYSLGFLNIYPYSPLVSPAGSTTAGYTVYVSFENVKLFGASAPQSGLKSKRYEQEISNKANGPISGPAQAIAKGFKEFSNIPLLSSYTTPISWIADRVSNVASIFGWSKPVQGDSILKIQQLSFAGHTNVDGDSDARTLALNMKPGVVKLDGFTGTEYDEMDFSYIVRKPAWFQTTTWSSSDLADNTITSFSVTPKLQYTLGGKYHFQPVAFVAKMFNLWRGSLVFRLKIVRTEFHSGRLQIAFFPEDPAGTYATGDPYVHRMIIDIREKSEIEFVVPFISNAAWIYGATGTIWVKVIDPLVAPATVSNTVTLLWEVSGGEDIEFSSPSNFASLTPSVFTPQSGLNEARLVSTVLGSSVVDANPIVATGVTIGEKITSFRSLLKRFTPIYSTNMNTTSDNFLGGGAVNIVYDSVIGTQSTPPTDYWRSDIVSTVASCYGVWRGGIRLRCLYNTGYITGTTAMATANALSQNNSSGTATNLITNAGTPGQITMNDSLVIQELINNPCLTVEIPQYTVTYGRSVCDTFNFQGVSSTYGSAYGYNTSTSQRYVYFTAPRSIATATSVSGYPKFTFFRALADDGNLGCFISVPAMTLDAESTGAVNNYY